MHRSTTISFLLLIAAGCAAAPDHRTDEGNHADENAVTSGVRRVKFTSGGRYLVVEVLDDDLVHFELSAIGAGPDVDTPLATSALVAKRDYAGPTSFTRNGDSMETPEIRVAVDPTTLCARVTDKAKGVDIQNVCPEATEEAWKSLTIDPIGMQHAYGLGQQFIAAGSADGDWTGRVRATNDPNGNAMEAFNGGFDGNTQIPILYALGPSGSGYAMFLDNVYKQQWSFTGSPWRVDMWGDQIRWYVMTGPDLQDLRRDYMELVGRPLVPPKKMFGLWVSEFGFENWGEIDDKLASLRSKGYPIDGFVLDLYWFGGVTSGSDSSNMGRVAWDRSRFPDPEGKIASYRDDQGIGLMTIEESYVSRGLPEHADMGGRGYLARDCDGCGPTYITANPWWGKGGMIDWSNDAGADYWHDLKRQPLVDMGVTAHWLDLGEPEMYNAWARYAGGAEPDVHNVFTFHWAESIARGYARNGVTKRPFVMARSGAAGIQRFGAAMWSADIASRPSSLATHMNAQLHMSMSGIDYYGSDIGGFHRDALDGVMRELFTQWFADGMMLDVPGRTHTDNDSCKNCYETAPDRVGDAASNLDNLRLRYELSAYVYSLAHQAYRTGDPIFPPPLFYYQDDATLRELGHEKMIGRDLLVGIVAGYGETERRVYLPAGKWIDYHSLDWTTSAGEWSSELPEYRAAKLELPLFARAGAIIPKMLVDDQTMNVLGKRKNGTRRDDLVLRVFSDASPSSFAMYEDDGETTAYQSGAVRETTIKQQASSSLATVTVGAAIGTYAGAPDARPIVVELVLDDRTASAVTVNGVGLAMRANKADFDASPDGFYRAAHNLVVAKSQPIAVGASASFAFALTADSPLVSLHFVCKNGTTTPGESVYVAGDVPELGGWSSDAAIKLDPNAYPKWTGVVAGLPSGKTIQWKCIKRSENGGPATAWQPGANNAISLPASGYAGTQAASF